MKLLALLVALSHVSSNAALPTEMYDEPPWLEDRLEARTGPNSNCFNPTALEDQVVCLQ